MKILQLCYKPPFPPVDGGTMAMNSITQGLLANGHNVKILSVCSDKHPVRLTDEDSQYSSRTGFEAVRIDLSIHPLDAAIALLCGESYNVKRFVSKEFDKRLSDILNSSRFDIVHVESIFLAPYLPTIRKLSDARVVLRAHNVEHRIWRQMALSTKNPFKRWYLKKLALSLRAYELEQLNLFDGVACITAADADVFRKEGCRRPMAVIPFAVDTPQTIDNVAEPLSLFHIGSMDWLPNSEGVHWLLDEVWPLIHKELPSLHLYLAGRKMPADLMERHQDGVTVVGEVDNAADFISSKSVNIVPLLSGSGMRVKIIEAMSLGKTVVSTSIGAQGIDCTDGVDILIADSPEQFLAQLRRCTDDPVFCQSVGENARRLVLDKYTTAAVTRQLVDFYNKIRQ